jgi:hypothetical protein
MGAGGGAGSAGGTGGTGGSGGMIGLGGAGGVQSTACVGASDCPQPPDSRCGYAMCELGECSLVVKPGPATSQKRGDCRQVVCDSVGNAEEKEDSSDVYNDGKPCTLDSCEAGFPKNEPLPDAITCPEAGGGVCYGGDCVQCIDNQTDCPTQGDTCNEFHCEMAGCIGNCGSGCAPCEPLKPCAIAEDCIDHVCINGKCALPTCQDGTKNGEETGVDCGAPSCGNLCADGEGCELPSDCISGVCWGAVCQTPTCKDGVQNGDELGIDCGGSCQVPCKATP